MATPTKPLALAFCLLAAMAPTARAELYGATIHWQYYDAGGPYPSGSNHGTFKVTKINTLVGQFGVGTVVYFNIRADHNSITFKFHPATSPGTWSNSVLSLAPTIHNGIALDLVSPGAIRSLTIDPATNMRGFDTRRVSFTAHQIQVDWQGLSFTNYTLVRLDIRVRKAAAQAAPAANGGQPATGGPVSR